METNLTPSANKISKEEFFKILDAQKAQNERVDKITDAGISIWDSDLVEYGNLMFERVIDAYFTKDGADWIFWWLYEKAGNPEMKAWDEDHDEIPMETKEDLWRYVKQYRK